MASGPVGAEPLIPADTLDTSGVGALQAEVARLTGELEAARARIRQLEQASHLSLFDDEPGHRLDGERLTGDGSDPRILSVILGATAVVAGMVALLALANGTLVSPFGAVMVLLTIGLAWGAARAHVVPTEVSVSRGVVYVEKGETTYRFDIRKPETRVSIVGSAGEPGWGVHFERRGLDPFVVDATMVSPAAFLADLREIRPEL